MNNKIIILPVLFFCGLLSGCQSKQTEENTAVKDATLPVLEIEIISISENTFGYDILKNDKIYIHQPHIPAISGNKGFNTEAQARKAAALVISKIGKNIIPPTITVVELDSLGALD